MSMGSWLLATYAPAAGAAALADSFGVLPAVGTAGALSAAALGPAVTTYTGVLLANTAVPAWHDARHELPFIFAGSAVASAASLALLHTPVDRAASVRRRQSFNADWEPTVLVPAVWAAPNVDAGRAGPT